MSNKNSFEMALVSASKLPLVKINRKEYLRKELAPFYSEDVINLAIENNPAYAGINVGKIHQIAESSINFETNKVTAFSAVAGLPGGFALVGTIPADLAQYTCHLLRIMQKLIYLYGWEELENNNDGFDDETKNLVTLFIGIMYGVNSAGIAVNKIAQTAAQRTSKKLAELALTKTFFYPIVKQVVIALGGKMTKEIFAKTVSKTIPLLGAGLSGGITYYTFKPMANKLKEHLSKFDLCDVDFYARKQTEKV